MPPTSIDLRPRVHGAIRLRRWREADAGPLFEAVAASRAELGPWMPWAPGYDRDDARAFIDAVPTLWAARSDFLYALTDDGQRVLGGHGLHRLPAPGMLMLGYWTTTACTGRGLATLAAAALTRAALELPEVDRVTIHHDRDNHRSAAIPAKLGFERLPDDPAVEASPEDGPSPAGPGGVRWVLTADRLDASAVPTVLTAAMPDRHAG